MIWNFHGIIFSLWLIFITELSTFYKEIVKILSTYRVRKRLFIFLFSFIFIYCFSFMTYWHNNVDTVVKNLFYLIENKHVKLEHEKFINSTKSIWFLIFLLGCFNYAMSKFKKNKIKLFFFFVFNFCHDHFLYFSLFEIQNLYVSC